MNFVASNLYHVYNQGNNKRQIFNTPIDYQFFLNNSANLLLPYSDILAFCLMPNHFHFMLQAKMNCSALVKQGGINIDSLTNGFRKLLSGYARVFNSRNNQSGSLFRQKTKAKCLNDVAFSLGNNLTTQDYCANCFNYIHDNPVAAGIVSAPGEWQWSSYRFYSGQGLSSFGNKQLAAKYCGYDASRFGTIPF